MRNWTELDGIYSGLFSSVYPQPEDEGHTELARKAIEWFIPRTGIISVVDFGCGTGFCQPIFQSLGVKEYLGIAWGKDVTNAQGIGRNVIQDDFNFLSLDKQFDGGIARHSLEHSPFPILTLCHWKRFIHRWLLIVLPAPEWYRYEGQNHFNVMEEAQAENIFGLAGWHVEHKRIEYRSGLPYMVAPLAETKYEYWYILGKK